MKNFKSVILSAFFLVIIRFGIASADSLDNLQASLVSGKYTIYYENITPPSRQASMKERSYVFDNKMYTADSFMMHQNVKGIISSDGINRYIETSAIQNSGLLYASCSLKKGDEIFYFTRLEDKKKVTYIGKVQQQSQKDDPTEKGKVTPMKFRYALFWESPTNLSDDIAVSKVLNALLPNSEKPQNALNYEKVGSGFLENGIEYVDLMATNTSENVIFDAIRYYFQNGKLIKISAGQYFGSGENLDGIRTIIKVTDFKTQAEKNFFELPKELKIKKRKD